MKIGILGAGAIGGYFGGILKAAGHDVAFVGEPGPDALVVAVCTRGYEAAAAEEALKSIGALAIDLHLRQV